MSKLGVAYDKKLMYKVERSGFMGLGYCGR